MAVSNTEQIVMRTAIALSNCERFCSDLLCSNLLLLKLTVCGTLSATASRRPLPGHTPEFSSCAFCDFLIPETVD